MRQSESIANLATALVAAQAAMGGAVKDASNPFFKSTYADLASVVKAIKEPFCVNGLSYVQLPHSTELGVGVTTRLMHVSGEWLESEFVLPLTKQDPQAAGAAVTYSRRYALQAMAGIPSMDDDGESLRIDAYTDLQLEEFTTRIEANNDPLGFVCFTKTIGDDAFIALQKTFPAGQIVARKAIANKLMTDGFNVLKEAANQVSDFVNTQDTGGLLQILQEFQTPAEKKLLAGLLTPAEIKALHDVRDLA